MNKSTKPKDPTHIKPVLVLDSENFKGEDEELYNSSNKSSMKPPIPKKSD